MEADLNNTGMNYIKIIFSIIESEYGAIFAWGALVGDKFVPAQVYLFYSSFSKFSIHKDTLSGLISNVNCLFMGACAFLAIETIEKMSKFLQIID